MKKTYTLFYSINDFNNEECQIIDTEETRQFDDRATATFGRFFN